MKTKKEKLFKIHEIEETPFHVLEKENLEKENKFKIILGNEIVSGDYDTLEEAKKQIEEKPWWLIIATTHIISERINKIKQEEIKNKINNLIK